MVKGLIGTKVKMTQSYDSHGRAVALTVIKIEPNFVTQIKTSERDGYKAAQIGSLSKKKISKSLSGHLKKADLAVTPKVLKEVEFDGDLKEGQQITLDQVFRRGQMVDVVGVSKGKGFAGVVKRWGFSGGPRTHGQSDRERAPGSIGATTTPGRVFKGLKMAGHMGSRQVTVVGLEIIDVNKEENTISVKGSVPGPINGVVLVKKSRKKREAYHEPEIPATPTVGGGKEEASEEKPEQVKLESQNQELAGD